VLGRLGPPGSTYCCRDVTDEMLNLARDDVAQRVAITSSFINAVNKRDCPLYPSGHGPDGLRHHLSHQAGQASLIDNG
jgi:hypothetical protein